MFRRLGRGADAKRPNSKGPQQTSEPKAPKAKASEAKASEAKATVGKAANPAPSEPKASVPVAKSNNNPPPIGPPKTPPPVVGLPPRHPPRSSTPRGTRNQAGENVPFPLDCGIASPSTPGPKPRSLYITLDRIIKFKEPPGCRKGCTNETRYHTPECRARFQKLVDEEKELEEKS